MLCMGMKVAIPTVVADTRIFSLSQFRADTQHRACTFSFIWKLWDLLFYRWGRHLRIPLFQQQGPCWHSLTLLLSPFCLPQQMIKKLFSVKEGPQWTTVSPVPYIKQNVVSFQQHFVMVNGYGLFKSVYLSSLISVNKACLSEKSMDIRISALPIRNTNCICLLKPFAVSWKTLKALLLSAFFSSSLSVFCFIQSAHILFTDTMYWKFWPSKDIWKYRRFFF